MQTIEIQKGVRVGFDDMVGGAAKMETTDLEKFQQQVSRLLAKRKATTLPKEETEMLLKINEGLPAATVKRYTELTAKMKKKPLGPPDHEELVQIIDQIELKDAERLGYLIELSRLRSVPLEVLMLQLGITNPPNGKTHHS